MATELGIGSTVWLFEDSRRVYPTDSSGGGPIYRGHFVAATIHGETARSWLVGHEWAPIRVDKKKLTTKPGYGRGSRVFVSEQEIDDACYIHDARPKLGRQVIDCRDINTLRKIEGLLKAAK